MKKEWWFHFSIWLDIMANTQKSIFYTLFYQYFVWLSGKISLNFNSSAFLNSIRTYFIRLYLMRGPSLIFMLHFCPGFVLSFNLGCLLSLKLLILLLYIKQFDRDKNLCTLPKQKTKCGGLQSYHWERCCNFNFLGFIL